MRIVDLLELRGKTTVQTLADALDATQQNMSKHLGLLHQAGIIARRREGRVWYALTDQEAFALLLRVADETVLRLEGLVGRHEAEQRALAAGAVLGKFAAGRLNGCIAPEPLV